MGRKARNELAQRAMSKRVARLRAGPPPASPGRRLLLVGLAALPAAVLGLWILVNRVEWLGPYVADGLRSVIGKDAVTELEDVAYAIQDRFYQYYRKNEKPKAYWSVPQPAELPASIPAAPAVVADSAALDVPAPYF